MDIKIEGLDNLINNLEDRLSGAKLEKAMKDATLLVEGEARKKAPKFHGELRRSIESTVKAGNNSMEGIIYSPLEYAPYVEYGTGLFAEGGNGRKDVPWNYQDDEGEWHSTSGQSPSPYMRPALTENKQKILNILKGGITNG